MFFRKKKAAIDSLQECIKEIQENNIVLSKTVNGLAENDIKLSSGLSEIQKNSIALANTLGSLVENETKIKAGLDKIQANNDALTEALGSTLNDNRIALEDAIDAKTKMQECINNVQANNLVLADVLHNVVKNYSNNSDSNSHPQYTEEEKWKAAYALNLCMVSVSQIIEYNDLRFMEQEYDNILNNLNLEMMPKDEALLDVLKQILDVINFFSIQSQEKKLLDKEYQQKMKDAIWSAVPNPSVILAGGSGGWIGLAVTAAISVGTGYMNYRKEKAKIGLEQERKNWELERSLMEQLHGLRRQLFETSWRLADEYQFTDSLRLTEKQIKQYNEILQDHDPLRQYYRLEYVHTQFEAYPPFWYHIGSAALKVAYENQNDSEIFRDFLDKANSHFEYYFEKSQKENKLLREDPVVAQCAFEYIATLDLKDNNKLLYMTETEKNRIIEKMLDLSVESSGNSLDVLQLCAINYLASGDITKAISILGMLVNEFYNVSSNAQILSMLYVKAAVNGDNDAETSYKLLTKTCPYKIEYYPMPADKANIDFDILDKYMCTKQRTYLAERFLTAIECYLNQSEIEFNDFWGNDYDITNEAVVYFQNLSDAMDTLRKGSGEMVKNKLSVTLTQIKDDLGETNIFDDISSRINYHFTFFVEEIISQIIKDLFMQLLQANNCESLSKIESNLMNFCNKYSLTSENNDIIESSNNETSIESILTGKSLAQLRYEHQEFEDYIKVIRNMKMCEDIVNVDSKEVDCYYYNSRKCEEYLARHNLNIKGKVLAIIEDRKGIVVKTDLLLTPKKLYVISRKPNGTFNKIEYELDYCDVHLTEKSDGIEYERNTKKIKVYSEDKKGINYSKLGDMLHELVKVSEKYSVVHDNSDTSKMIMSNAVNRCKDVICEIECLKQECDNLLLSTVSI